MTFDVDEVSNRLGRIEETLRLLLQEHVVQKFYIQRPMLQKSSARLSSRYGNGVVTAVFTPRSGVSGRGNSKEWMVSHEELERVKAEGLVNSQFGS